MEMEKENKDPNINPIADNMIKSFSGNNNQNVSLHIKNFSFYLATRHLPRRSQKGTEDENNLLQVDQAEIHVFGQTLTGAAETWYQRVKYGTKEGEIRNLDQLLKAFTVRFQRDQTQDWKEIVKLMNIKQKPGQSVEVFFKEVEDMA